MRADRLQGDEPEGVLCLVWMISDRVTHQRQQADRKSGTARCQGHDVRADSRHGVLTYENTRRGGDTEQGGLSLLRSIFSIRRFPYRK